MEWGKGVIHLMILQVSVKKGRDKITRKHVLRMMAFLCDADAHTAVPEEEMFQLPISSARKWAEKMLLPPASESSA